MDVPHSCHTTKSKMMAPTLRVQVKTWNHGDCTGVVGRVVRRLVCVDIFELRHRRFMPLHSCRIDHGQRHRDRRRQRLRDRRRGLCWVGNCSGWAGTGSGRAAAGSTGTTPGSAECPSGCTGTTVSAPLSGGLAIGALPNTAVPLEGRVGWGCECASGGRREIPCAASHAARTILPIAASSEGAPSPACHIGAQSTSGMSPGRSLSTSARLGHDPLDEFRTQDPRVEAHVAPALGSVLGFEARGRHSHYAFMGTGTQADVCLACRAALLAAWSRIIPLSVGHREGLILQHGSRSKASDL